MKYFKEIIILLIQLIIFYIVPFFINEYDSMGMVLMIIILTFILSLILGLLSNKRIKYLYPIVISLLFIPSVFIYYNESAIVHSLWYLTISIIGLLFGITLNKLICKK